jgi:hypothetical protein
MKWSRNFLALLLAALHFGWCLLFFTLYFQSADPQRAMAFVLFIPIDPWIILLAELSISEAALALILTILGTAQWWGIGLLLGKAHRHFRNKPAKQSF